MKVIAPLQLWVGFLLLAAGGWIITGWALRQPSWVQFRPEYVAMVINTALCFSLMGIGLLLPLIAGSKKSFWQGIIGWVVLLISTAVMFQIITRIDLGIDWPSLHAWLQDGNPQPGRMAPNTALGFSWPG